MVSLTRRMEPREQASLGEEEKKRERARKKAAKNSICIELLRSARCSTLTNAARGQAARGGESEGHLGGVGRGAEGGSAGGVR